MTVLLAEFMVMPMDMPCDMVMVLKPVHAPMISAPPMAAATVATLPRKPIPPASPTARPSTAGTLEETLKSASKIQVQLAVLSFASVATQRLDPLLTAVTRLLQWRPSKGHDLLDRAPVPRLVIASGESSRRPPLRLAAFDGAAPRREIHGQHELTLPARRWRRAASARPSLAFDAVVAVNVRVYIA